MAELTIRTGSVLGHQSTIYERTRSGGQRVLASCPTERDAERIVAALAQPPADDGAIGRMRAVITRAIDNNLHEGTCRVAWGGAGDGCNCWLKDAREALVPTHAPDQDGRDARGSYANPLPATDEGPQCGGVANGRPCYFPYLDGSICAHHEPRPGAERADDGEDVKGCLG
jgi:hypothetical protein